MCTSALTEVTRDAGSRETEPTCPVTFRCIGVLQLSGGRKIEVYWLKEMLLTFPHLCFSDKTFIEAPWPQGQDPLGSYAYVGLPDLQITFKIDGKMC